MCYNAFPSFPMVTSVKCFAMSSIKYPIPEHLLNPPEEILDNLLENMQSAGIKLVKWGTLLYRQLNAPHAHTVGLFGLCLNSKGQKLIGPNLKTPPSPVQGVHSGGKHR